MGFFFDGEDITIPGAYGVREVARQTGSNFPAFNVGLIIAKSFKGAPYNASANGNDVLLPYSSAAAVARDYGHDDIYKIFTETQKVYPGVIFILNAQPNTAVSAILKDKDNSNSVEITPEPLNYGVLANDTQINVADSADLDTVIETHTATSGTANKIIKSTATWTSDVFKGKFIKIISGTGKDQIRQVSTNNGTDITVSSNWGTNPDNTSVFQVLDAMWQITVVGTKNEKILTADVASGDNAIYVNSLRGLSNGMQFALMNNPTGFISYYSIVNMDSTFNAAKNGYKVILDTAINSNAITKANYARIVQFDTDNKTVVQIPNAEYNLDNFVTVLNKVVSGWIFTKKTGATLPPANTSGSRYIGQISGAVKGTNPTVSSQDYLNIAELYPDWTDEFENLNKVNIRLFTLGTSDSAVHMAYKALGTILSSSDFKKPPMFIVGNDLNETANDAVARAKTLNTDMFILAAGGDDGFPAYLTFAPQIFGLLMKYDINHNLTRDELDFVKPEKQWSREDLIKLTKNGVMTYKPFKTGYKVVRGILTYQDQSNEWNEQDVKTFLVQQKQLADAFDIDMLTEMDEQAIGADNITQSDIELLINGVILRNKTAGRILDSKLLWVKRVSSGWIYKTETLLPGVTDFIGAINVIRTF